MNADTYADIIYKYLMPFWPRNNEFAFIHQDNDSKHSSKQCREALESANIKWVFVKK